MGTDKAFLRVGDELLIERQLRCLRESGAAETLISGRDGIDYSQFQGRAVYDEQPNSGPLGGVASLLNASSYPLLLVLAVDMPAMTAAMLAKILCLCTEDCGCVPVDGGRLQPLAAIYPQRSLSLARSRIATLGYSMSGFVNQAIAEQLLRTIPIEPQDRECFVNWNRPSDWQPASR